MPSGTRASVNFSPWLATQVHFFVSFGLLAGLESSNWVSEGPKGLQKGTPKSFKIEQKSIRAALGMPKGVRGYPPGPSEAPNMHFYAYLCICCAYRCIFMHILRIPIHIYAYFVHIYACFHQLYAYLCILLHTSPIFMHIYPYLHIFKHTYECVCISDAYLYTSALFVNVCTYLHIPIHEKTLDAGSQKSCSRATPHRELKYLQVQSI